MRNLIFVLVIFVSTCINAVSSEIITEIQDHWNKIDTMSGQFRQEDSDGTISHGNFYFLKPYRSKFIYHDKAENVITNESLLVIVDNDDRKIESYSIGNNVLKNLLSNELLIKQQFDLVNFHISDNQYVLSLQIKDNEKNQLKIAFDSETLDLKKWEIYDEFQNKTVLEFTKIKKNIFISQNLFVVKYN